MRILLLALLACGGTAPAPVVHNALPSRASPFPRLIGRWCVVGCETSPMDPADCGRGEIVFTADRVTIDVPAAEQNTHTYVPLSSATDRVAVRIDDDVSVITLDPDGTAHWRAPGMGGRVGRLSFRSCYGAARDCSMDSHCGGAR